jgi:hypothetical protein
MYVLALRREYFRLGLVWIYRDTFYGRLREKETLISPDWMILLHEAKRTAIDLLIKDIKRDT